ncbi:SDR family oxidoreductase [Nocardia sp. CA-135398]|uniref:SDR family oxidoreductase n=1 Tax=Nocardia sp. CA-135398 TaxID=3239977 RepID=UPI003D99D0BF
MSTTLEDEQLATGRPLTGRRAVVSGAATGIGAAAVAAFLDAGADVVGLLPHTPPPDELKGRCDCLSCDARHRASVATAFESATTILGGLDILPSASGGWQPSSPETLTEDEFDFVLDTNLRTTVLTHWPDRDRAI